MGGVAFAASCDEIICESGDVYPSCDDNGKEILYVRNPCPESIEKFSDLSGDDPYAEAITGLQREGVLKGYPDGTFRSTNPVSRVELLKMLLQVLGGYRPTTDTANAIYALKGLTFTDVYAKEWYIPYLRRAVEQGWVKGYPDGTVKPGSPVVFAEAAKLIASAYNMDVGISEPWYRAYVDALGRQAAIPTSIEFLESPLKRGEMAEILWRLREKITDRPSKEPSFILARHCEQLPGGQQVAGVDMKTVSQAWLLWINGARSKLALQPYVLNEDLARTAHSWATLSANRGYITHTRPGATAVYDYDGVLQWFAEQGVTFGNLTGSRYAENIAYGPMECHKAECTREMIAMTRAVFDAFMAEKGTNNDPHYRSVVHKDFRQMGIGIALDAEKRNYYMTVHYAVDAQSELPPLCS